MGLGWRLKAMGGQEEDAEGAAPWYAVSWTLVATSCAAVPRSGSTTGIVRCPWLENGV